MSVMRFASQQAPSHPRAGGKTMLAAGDYHSGETCSCGSSLWVVDTDGQGKYWLLCIDPHGQGCIETKPVPDDVVIDDGSLDDPL